MTLIFMIYGTDIGEIYATFGGKTLFHGQKLDGLVHLACLCEFFKILDVLGQNEIFYVIFG